MKTGELGAHCARAKTRVWLPGKRCLFDLSKVGATLAAAGFLLAGCSGGPPTLAGPKRINPAIEEVAGVQELFADMKKVWPAYLKAPPENRTAARNEIIAARMYAIDINYTEYERALNAEGKTTEFWAKVASSTLTTIATAVPVSQTIRGLNAIAHGTDLAASAYNDAFFRQQLLQNLTTSMRAARHDRRAVIRNRMACSSDIYPLGIALSDIESYYRAGTIESGIIRLTRTNTNDEKKAKNNDDTAGATANSEAKKKQQVAETSDAAADAAKTEVNRSGCNVQNIRAFYLETGDDAETAFLPTKKTIVRRSPPASPPANTATTSKGIAAPNG